MSGDASSEYAIEYDRSARSDLRSIYRYVSFKLNSPRAAKRLYGKLVKQINKLNEFPARHRVVDWEPWHTRELRRMPVENYTVYYRVIEEKLLVTIFRVLYRGRSAEELFEQ